MKTEKKPDPQQQKRKKILYGSLYGAGGVLALLAVIGIILYCSIRSRLYEKPRTFQGPALTTKDFSPLNTAGKKIADAFSSRNGALPAEAHLAFTEQETEALLHFASQFTTVRTEDGVAKCRFHWKNGRLVMEACYVLRDRPKGKNALNVDMEAVPYISKGRIKLRLLSLKAGSVNTPGAFLSIAASRIVRQLEENPDVLTYGKCVKSLSASPGGGVDLVMDTKELMRLSGGVPRIGK
ncbi:MAG: hypothetical protein J6A21_05365 [Lentisphaeria bacterium]|nr:hypothetical protein [Lentisphaeria bacterium]